MANGTARAKTGKKKGGSATRPTTVAESVTAAGDRGAYDAACKRLLAERPILAWVLRAALPELTGVPADRIARECIAGEPNVGGGRLLAPSREDPGAGDGSVFYDVLCAVTPPGAAGASPVLVNVEAQKDPWRGYPLVKRAIYYCARMLSSQRGTLFKGDDYGSLRKVCSIWVCTDPPKRRAGCATRYDIAQTFLAGKAGDRKERYDMLAVVMLYPVWDGEPRTAPAGAGEGYNEANRLLGALFSPGLDAKERKRVLSEEYGIPMTERLEGEVDEMCTLEEAVEARGVERGRRQGMRQGMKQGVEKGLRQGIEKGVCDSLRNLMRNAGVGLDRAMELIGVPEAQRPDYAKLLGK